VGIEVSFCVVNTNGRELLMRCLDAVRAQRVELAAPAEVLVLDNASDDGSAAAVRARGEDIELVELTERRGKALNDSDLMARARGRYCLLLNEDSELMAGAASALYRALEEDARAACAVAALRRPDGSTQASAWRFPSVKTALAAALMLARPVVVQSRGTATRRVEWGQSAALAVRREAAEQVGWMDPEFFVYSDEVDFQKRLSAAGWHTLYVPAAVAIHHEQLSTGALPGRRIVENARGRDRYMRKHHGVAAAALVRCLTAWSYGVRALAALVLPGHDPRRYSAHAVAALWPARGQGLREAADEYNAGLPRNARQNAGSGSTAALPDDLAGQRGDAG
jgi:N-acetylglucosaminyl-diphospho-decaprenol L-rhamnosyltransferase